MLRSGNLGEALTMSRSVFDWAAERVLPWQHLEGPLPVATLWKHRSEAGLSP